MRQPAPEVQADSARTTRPSAETGGLWRCCHIRLPGGQRRSPSVPAVLPIDDPRDPRVAAYLSVRERDLVGREDRFVAEGEVVLRVLLTRARHRVESLLLAEGRLGPLRPLLEPLGEDVPVYVASKHVLHQVAGFPVHRGVLAVGHREAEPSPGDLLRSLASPALALGLVGIANHDNVGGLYRNAAAFGAGAVIRDPATCDPLYRKAIRVSVGAALVVPSARAESAAELLDHFHAAGFEVLSLSPSGHEALSAIRPAARTALLLGSEGPGLPPELLGRTRTVRIPMAAGFDSLNVATASGIALHALASSLHRQG